MVQSLNSHLVTHWFTNGELRSSFLSGINSDDGDDELKVNVRHTLTGIARCTTFCSLGER